MTDRTFDRIFYGAVAAYLLVICLTYGHAFNMYRSSMEASNTKADTVFIGAFLSAAAWPFYWSVQFWKGRT